MLCAGVVGSAGGRRFIVWRGQGLMGLNKLTVWLSVKTQLDLSDSESVLHSEAQH